MNTTTNEIKKKTQEETKMKKFIVEAPEPKKGQTVSSGGIRENGKIAVQYKNPVPYEKPTLPTAVTSRASNMKLIPREQFKTCRNETLMYLLGILWKEFGEPLLREGLNKLEEKTVSFIFNRTTKPQPKQSIIKEPEIIDVEAEEISPVIDDDKIIRFPSKKAI